MPTMTESLRITALRITGHNHHAFHYRGTQDHWSQSYPGQSLWINGHNHRAIHDRGTLDHYHAKNKNISSRWSLTHRLLPNKIQRKDLGSGQKAANESTCVQCGVLKVLTGNVVRNGRSVSTRNRQFCEHTITVRLKLHLQTHTYIEIYWLTTRTNTNKQTDFRQLKFIDGMTTQTNTYKQTDFRQIIVLLICNKTNQLLTTNKLNKGNSSSSWKCVTHLFQCNTWIRSLRLSLNLLCCYSRSPIKTVKKT